MKSKKEIATEALTIKHPNYQAIMKVLQSDTEELYFNGVKEPKITGKLATFKNISKAINNHIKDLDAYDSEERSREIENILLEPLPLLSIQEIDTLNNLWKNKFVEKVSLSYLHKTEKPEFEELVLNENIAAPSQDFELILDSQLNLTIQETLLNIGLRERNVIKMRYGINAIKPMTLAEVSDYYGVTSHRISQIEEKAIRQLRHPTKSYPLTDFIDIKNEDKYESIDRVNKIYYSRTDIKEHASNYPLSPLCEKTNIENTSLPDGVIPFDEYFNFDRINKLANAIVILDNAIKYDCFVYARKLKDIILGIKYEMEGYNYFLSLDMATKKSLEIALMANKEIIRLEFKSIKDKENYIFRGLDSNIDPIEYMSDLYSDLDASQKSNCPLYEAFINNKIDSFEQVFSDEYFDTYLKELVKREAIGKIIINMNLKFSETDERMKNNEKEIQSATSGIKTT
jgi:RNA polymerase sigma factor (sigma-70 family)